MDLLALLALSAILSNAQALTCYSRSTVSSPTSNGSTITCATSGYVCYSYVAYSGTHYAGCATNCSSYSFYMSCLTCSTSNCNTVTPSSISCYTRAYSSNTPSATACPTGVTACYNVSFDGEAGCGSCTSSSISSFGCSSCSSNYCNWDGQVLPVISCYSRSGSSVYTSDTTSSCSAGSCYEYSITLGSSSTYYAAGCGTCAGYNSYYPNCRTCSTNNCNSNGSSISCYISYSSGIVNATCSGNSSCYSYSTTMGTYTYYNAGCGSCSSSAPASCTSCYTDYCNSLAEVGSSVASVAGVSLKMTASVLLLLRALIASL